ncbi:MAG: hypothetical protein CVU64_19355 [Deltaproteobacteria bacterium HGW-Deltaproteobacteria-21]|nr:MAG: hypothetical protein CVU64_19355 [Deltaproteobacteria bacterium HGW-Deltaproteobacteria-21]
MCPPYVRETNDNGLWKCPDNKANHGRECSLHNLVAADVLAVRFWPKPKEVVPDRGAGRTEEEKNKETGS